MLLMICSVFMITGCKPKEYTVTLKFEDGAVFETITVEEGISTTLNTPSKDGYTFAGCSMLTEVELSPIPNLSTISVKLLQPGNTRVVINKNVINKTNFLFTSDPSIKYMVFSLLYSVY